MNFDTDKPGNSPCLLRLMQQNEKRVSDNFKKKYIKSSLKKLKKEENVVKSAVANRKRLKVRAIQEMFDNLAKKNASEKDKNITEGGQKANMGNGGQKWPLKINPQKSQN